MTSDGPGLAATLTGGPSGSSPVLVRRLVVLHAPHHAAVGRLVPLLGSVELGRTGSLAAALDLADGRQSRQHLRIEEGASSWRAIDLESRNGTFVDGVRIEEPMALSHGSVIRVGDSLLLFEQFSFGPEERLAPERAPLWGPSLGLERVRGDLTVAASRDVPVLLTGETGVGKEVAAELLHRASGRPGHFVPVNCGALPSELIESELFGHVDGAFTGARAKEGLFQAASGGTIFLDEIGELPLVLQPRLLRVLANGELRPVGSTQPRHVDVRVVAATNRDLEIESSNGTFRGDLFARLAGRVVRIPPLRERKADVLALAGRLPADLPPAIEADAAEALLLHDWPFNVRELSQVLQSASIEAEGASVLELQHLPESLRSPVQQRGKPRPTSDSKPPLELLVRRSGTPSKEELSQVLAHYAGNVAQVATFFERDRAQVYRWLRRYSLDASSFRSESSP